MYKAFGGNQCSDNGDVRPDNPKKSLIDSKLEGGKKVNLSNMKLVLKRDLLKPFKGRTFPKKNMANIYIFPGSGKLLFVMLLFKENPKVVISLEMLKN